MLTYFRSSRGRFVIGPAHALRTSPHAALEPAPARRVVAEWACDVPEAQLRALYVTLGEVSTSEWLSREDIVRAVLARIGRGLAVVPQPEQSHTLVPVERVELHEAAPPEENCYLNYTFQYPDGTAFGGCKYRFLEPNGSASQKTLPSSGLIDRQGAVPGMYEVQLHEVQFVSWAEPRVRCGVSVGIRARVTGFDDGTSAKVRIFREHEEADDEALATLSSTVSAGAVETEFKYDYAASDDTKSEQGVVRFVAEVALEGGKVWGKSPSPLAVQLKTLQSARWEHADVGGDQDAVLVVRALGYPPGTQVALALWTHDHAGGPQKLADLDPVPLQGEQALATLRFAPIADLDAPTYQSGTIRHAGEYYVVATIEDDVHREARSDLVACHAYALSA